MQITTTDLLAVLDSRSSTQVEKTCRLNELGNKEIEVVIDGWTIDDWRPRDEWFLLKYILKGEMGQLKLVFTPSERLNNNVSKIIEDLKENEGVAITIQGISEEGGHSISSMFSIRIESLRIL